MQETSFSNPFRPGAGHMPPYLAGRDEETKEFLRLLKQDTILENLVLTGLRGVGKTVLLETFKPLAVRENWGWVGTDLSESTSINESAVAIRLITDLSVITSNIVFDRENVVAMGFSLKEHTIDKKLTYGVLAGMFEGIPGLVSDKLKGLLEFVWGCMTVANVNIRGVVFAYDEAQTMSNYTEKEQYPLSLLLDVFQSLQRKGVPFLLALTGLPTLFPKLVEARTFSERMFRVVFLDKLKRKDSRDAIIEPIRKHGGPFDLSEDSIELIINVSGGYPYFIQFICKEVYDVFIQQHGIGKISGVPIEEITRKLDNDFFAGRWAKATDRQRELLHAIADLPNADEEFTIQEIVEQSKGLEKPFGDSQVNQMLLSLANKGLIYKNRHGRYSFAVPLLAKFISRQFDNQQRWLFDNIDL